MRNPVHASAHVGIGGWRSVKLMLARSHVLIRAQAAAGVLGTFLR